MPKFRRAVLPAVTRGATLAAFVAGLGSFVYGLKSDAQWRWIWILLGVFVVGAVSKFVWQFAVEVQRRYAAYPDTVEALTKAQADTNTLTSRVTAAEEAAVKGWDSGLQEGMGRTFSTLASQSVELAARHYDLLGGRIRVTATAKPDSSPVNKHVRMVLRHADSGASIAILSVVSVDGETVILEPTVYVDPVQWPRIEDKAASGDAVPPGLALEACTLDDYAQFPDPTTVSASENLP